MRKDARDRFGPPLKHRFTHLQIRDLCTAAGLVDLQFSPNTPFWCVVGIKSNCNSLQFT